MNSQLQVGTGASSVLDGQIEIGTAASYTCNRILGERPWLRRIPRSVVRILAAYLRALANGLVELFHTAESFGKLIEGQLHARTVRDGWRKLEQWGAIVRHRVLYRDDLLRLPDGTTEPVKRPMLIVRPVEPVNWDALERAVLKRSGFTNVQLQQNDPPAGGINGDPDVCSDSGFFSTPTGVNAPRVDTLDPDTHTQTPLTPQDVAERQSCSALEAEDGAPAGRETDVWSCSATTVEPIEDGWSPPEPDDAEPMEAEAAAEEESQQWDERETENAPNAEPRPAQDDLSRKGLPRDVAFTETERRGLVVIHRAMREVLELEQTRGSREATLALVRRGVPVDQMAAALREQAITDKLQADPVALFRGGGGAETRVRRLAAAAAARAEGEARQRAKEEARARPSAKAPETLPKAEPVQTFSLRAAQGFRDTIDVMLSRLGKPI